MTWSQLSFWDSVAGAPPDLDIPLVVPVPRGCGVTDVLSAISALVSAHETLRTRLVVSESGAPRQTVSTSADIDVLIVDTDDPEQAIAGQRDA